MVADLRAVHWSADTVVQHSTVVLSLLVVLVLLVLLVDSLGTLLLHWLG
jgi:hypothetical protein